MLKKSIFVILYFLITINCSHRFVINESYKPIEIKDNYLLVHSLEGNKIKIKESARDSVITILKSYNLYPSDSLWCIVEYFKMESSDDQFSKWVLEKYTEPDTSKPEPEYSIFFRNSEKDKKRQIDMLKSEMSNQSYIYTSIFWDVIISINKEKNKVIGIE